MVEEKLAVLPQMYTGSIGNAAPPCHYEWDNRCRIERNRDYDGWRQSPNRTRAEENIRATRRMPRTKSFPIIRANIKTAQKM